MNDPISHYTPLRTQMTALEVCWCGRKGMLYLFCVRYLMHVLMFLLLFVPFGCCVQCWVAGWRETWSAAGRWARCAWSRLCLSGPGPPGKEYLQYHSLLRGRGGWEWERQEKMRDCNTTKTNFDTTFPFLCGSLVFFLRCMLSDSQTELLRRKWQLSLGQTA